MTPTYHIFYIEENEKIILETGICESFAKMLSEKWSMDWKIKVEYKQD